MADCYYHGYSGGPGPCSLCESEQREHLEPGTLVNDVKYQPAEVEYWWQQTPPDPDPNK